MNTIHTAIARQGLVRPQDGRVIGGVCAGIARKFGLDAWAVRALLVLALMLLPGSQLLVYPIAWVLMPDASFTPLPTPQYTAPQHTAPVADPVTAPASTGTPQDTLTL